MRKEIIVPNSIIDVMIKNHYISITGVLGTLIHVLHTSVVVKLENMKSIVVFSKNKYVNVTNKAVIGTTAALIRNMLLGVTQGFSKRLQLVGIGYRASITDNIVDLIIGLSHSVRYKFPAEVKAICINQTEILLTSMNKQLIGQVAADLRFIRPPEPFKGKGIRYIDEVICNKGTKKR